MSPSRRSPYFIAILIIGIGLIAAPAVFQMFTRAPLGGDMINDFRPYMTTSEITKFEGYLDEIRLAEAESREVLRAGLLDADVITAPEYDAQYILVSNFNNDWPAVDADMSDLMSTMRENIDNFEDVDALPPFPLFPWFFVFPGLFVAIVAAVALRRTRSTDTGKLTWTLVGLGIAIVLAPAVFQMFTRAPSGGEMIDDFRPMMVQERVQAVQGYFILMGGAEGQLRSSAVPLAESSGIGPLPAIGELSADWPTIVGEFAPMIGTMVDNVDNYEAVDALPPFALFPWFFVVPGLLIAVLGLQIIRLDRAEPHPAVASGEPDERAPNPRQKESATG